MPYRDMFTDDIYQNEYDETMTRKFPNTYKVIKIIYPDVYKLPEDEIHTMSNILRHQGDTYDEAENLVKSYINENKSRWKKKYINPTKVLDDNIISKTNAIGESLADIRIAYDFYSQMKDTNKKLISKYGRNTGAADGTDNYYHPLLQCHLAKISPLSKQNGIGLGYLKEGIMDYVPKRLKGQTHQEVMKDSLKDLKNNAYGSNLGSEYPKKSCVQMLKEKRTRNMKYEGLF